MIQNAQKSDKHDKSTEIMRKITEIMHSYILADFEKQLILFFDFFLIKNKYNIFLKILSHP